MTHRRGRGRGSAAVVRLVVATLSLASSPAGRARAATPPDPRCPGPTLRSDLPPPSARPWMDASLPADRRAELLLAQMTLEEEVDLSTGERCLLYGYYDAPNARLGIPALTMTDGPAGVRIPYERVNGGKATLLPAPLALAASWDPELATLHGDVLGTEAFLTGHDVLLGPTLDLVRTPLSGRTFETLGEDPLLASRLAVPMIRAIQSHAVLADAKHFAVYTQETDRWTVDARVDERALRELWLAPFEAAVRDAGVASVMCGFNRVNGTSACENRALVDQLLKGELGFQGFVLSDWGAIHGTKDAALGGLDLEMAFAKYYGPRLVEAVRSGAVPREVVDDKARRLLRSMFRVGLFDRPVELGPLPVDAHADASRRIAEEGMVLLANGGVLPLGSPRSIAVIGADAANASTMGGGASRVEPTRSVSPLDGIRARAGPATQVRYAAGTDPVGPAHLLPGPPPIPSSVLAPAGDPEGRGLRAEFWFHGSFDGAPDVVRVDPQPAIASGFFDYQSVNASSLPQLPQRFALVRWAGRWTGTLTAPATGDYELVLTSRGESWLRLDGRTVIDHAGPHDLTSAAPATVHLVAGEPHAIQVDYLANASSIGHAIDVGGDLKLGWRMPGGAVAPAIADAAALAAASDVAVVVVRDYGTEERDRPSLALPNDQDALVAAVAAANPRTVVVLTTGQPTSMPWLSSVGAVLEAWYPGQMQGDAIARVLFGDVSPSGKLPITFPRAEDQGPQPAAAPPDGGDPALDMSEGTLLGYRWYDARGVDPLFPFGHGLSYTTFRYDALDAQASPDGGSVSFTLTNTGERAAAEVAQAYVGACPGDPARAPRTLAGFARVELAAGGSQRVTIPLDGRAMSTWSPAAHAWIPPTCDPVVAVGSSSRDLRLTAPLSGAPAPGPSTSAGGEPGPGKGGAGCASTGDAGGAAATAGALAAGLLALRRRRAGAQASRRPGGRRRAGRPSARDVDPVRGPYVLAKGTGAPGMELRFEELGDALIATPMVRALDSAVAPELRRELCARIRGRRLVVVSLEHVREVDCSGLACLVLALKELAPGGELRLASAGRAVRELLATTHLDELLPVHRDVAAALPPGVEPELAPSA